MMSKDEGYSISKPPILSPAEQERLVRRNIRRTKPVVAENIAVFNKKGDVKDSGVNVTSFVKTKTTLPAVPAPPARALGTAAYTESGVYAPALGADDNYVTDAEKLALHPAVTLDTNADTVLSLSTQALGLDTQTAARVFAGPATGVPAVPTFRALAATDIPALAYEPVDVTIVRTGQANWIDLTDGGATTLHSHAGGGGDISGTVIAGQLVAGVTDTKHITSAAIIPPATNILTLTNAAASTLALAITGTKTLTLTSTGDFNLTIPATGTAALRDTANTFTVAQTIDTSTTAGASFSAISTDTSSGILLQTATVNGSPKFLWKSATTNRWYMASNITNTGDWVLYGYGSPAGSKFYITSAGNVIVGVGITSGAARFNVTGTTDIVQTLITGFTTQAVATPMAQITRNDAAAGISAMLGLTALGSGANGDGGSVLLNGKTSTTAATAMGLDQWLWVNATHASRTARRVFNVYDTAVREALRIEASGTAPMVGFLGANAVVRPAKASHNNWANISDVVQALVDLGLADAV